MMKRRQHRERAPRSAVWRTVHVTRSEYVLGQLPVPDRGRVHSKRALLAAVIVERLKLALNHTNAEIGQPIELTVDSVGVTHARLYWMPPSPLRSAVTGYRLQYSTKTEDASPTTVDLSGEDLTCKNRNAPPTRRCYKLPNLKPMMSYGAQVQARAESGNWGDWSTKVYFTTREDGGLLNGSLYLISNTDTNIKVRV